MKRLLAGFTLMAVALAFTVGTTGCTKKEPTIDNPEKNKKPSGSDVMVKPDKVKPKAPSEPTTLPEDKPGTTPPPPIPVPKEDKKITEPLPKLVPPPDSPKKDNKGASLDRPLRPSRDAVRRAAFEAHLVSL